MGCNNQKGKLCKGKSTQSVKKIKLIGKAQKQVYICKQTKNY